MNQSRGLAPFRRNPIAFLCIQLVWGRNVHELDPRTVDLKNAAAIKAAEKVLREDGKHVKNVVNQLPEQLGNAVKQEISK